MRFERILEILERYTLFALLAVFPVFILTSFASPYVVPKEILLVAGISFLTLLWVIKIIVKGSISFAVGKFDLGVLFLGISYLLGTILATPNKMEALLFPGTTTFVLGGVLLYFLINQFDKKTKEGAGYALFAGSILLSLSMLLSTLGVYSKIPQLPAFVKDANFNPIGGNVPAAIYLAVFLLYSVTFILKEKETVKKLFFGVTGAVLVLSLILLVGNALPGKPQAPRLVSMQTSWEVTVDTFKKSPIFGAGPANYLTAFNLYRPVTYNATDLWPVRFTTASNYYFTHLTETGLLGLIALIVLLFTVYRFFKNEPKANVERYSIVLLLVLFVVLPGAPAIMVLLFSLLSLYSLSENKSTHMDVAAGSSSRVPAVMASLPLIAGLAAVWFFGFKYISAEVTFKKSLDALAKNDAKGTYDLMAKAINQNPKVDRYHASFSQVNMALAQSVANKENITDADRTTITQLVQQAISEGKAVVSLNPGRSGNWELLAQIYRAIMSFATGADQFAIQTYSQAVALDPTNPNLRISLGGVYYALGRYDNAIEAFKLAVLAKPDLANAHYNLAVAYREKKDYDNAIAQMKAVLTLVSKDSQDYTLANNVLAELEKNRPAKATEGTENLTPPQKVEDSNVKPPIELPKEATPPAAQP